MGQGQFSTIMRANRKFEIPCNESSIYQGVQPNLAKGPTYTNTPTGMGRSGVKQADRPETHY